MQHLTKSLSQVALFAVLSVSLVVYLNGFISDRISSFERTRVSRSRMQTQIHDTLEKRYDARILDTRLLGRCGITAYIVTLRDTAGGESTLYFDIDTGVPVRHDLLNGCPPRRTGSATGDGADAGVRVGRHAAALPDSFGRKGTGGGIAFSVNSDRPASLVPMRVQGQGHAA